jgi:hypothetical protein
MTMHVTTDKIIRTAVLDEAHVGHIRGALGTILHHDTGPRRNWKHRLQTSAHLAPTPRLALVRFFLAIGMSVMASRLSIKETLAEIGSSYNVSGWTISRLQCHG